MRVFLLDLLRSISILMLLMAHIGQEIKSPLGSFFGLPGFYYISMGGFAVTIFLILSGLVLNLQDQPQGLHYGHFITKRCLRIYPVYYMSLVIGVLIYLLKAYVDSSLFDSFSIDPFNVILGLTGYYAFAGLWGGPFLATSWFVGLIMTMYLLYPIISKYMKKSSHLTIVLLFVVSTLSRIILGKYGAVLNRPLDWFPLCRVFEFGLGIYLSVILRPAISKLMNSPKHGMQLIRYISDLSFPLFLIHYPLLFMIDYFSDNGLCIGISVSIFLSMSIVLSSIVLFIDNRLPRQLILRKVINR
jgi:peptidoglycan/LPS O-acetylase OafA/YrhL